MEIIKINEKYEKPKLIEYGCVCPKCKSVFIFDSRDFTLNTDITDSIAIQCPNNKCNKLIDMNDNAVVKFTDEFTKEDFKYKYDE